MDIKELKEEKRLLEKNIQKYVFQVVEDFKKRTEQSVSSIWISMIDVTTIDSYSEKEYVVGNVSVEVII